MGKKFTPHDVAKIAKLANIPVKGEEMPELASGFTTTINIVDQFPSVDASGFQPVSQVTGLKNVFREDEVDKSRVLSQSTVFANTEDKKKYKGYFVVPGIFGDDN